MRMRCERLAECPSACMRVARVMTERSTKGASSVGSTAVKEVNIKPSGAPHGGARVRACESVCACMRERV